MFIIKYFTVFYLFLCFSSGFASIFGCLILYYKYKITEIKKYLFFLLTISFIILIITANFYYKSIFSLHENNFYNYYFFTSLLIGVCCYIYTLPLFIHSLIKKFFIKDKIFLIIAIIPTIIYLLLILIKFMFKLNYKIIKIPVYLAEVILIFVIFYIFCLILFHYQSIEDRLRKKVLKYIVFLIILYSPFAVIDSFYDKFYFIFQHLPDGFSFSAPYYFFWNIITLILGAKYLLKTSMDNYETISKKVIKKYHITSREKEVAFYLMKGLTNQEISDKIFISMTTVKKHIYNIFQKTNAKNRVDLINILKDNINN